MLKRVRRQNARIGAATVVAVAATIATSIVTATSGHTVDAGIGAASSPSAAPLGDLPGWRQIFRDDFSTDVPLGQFPAAVKDRWGAYPAPWTDSTGKGQYNPEKVVSIDNGVLNKRLHVEKGRPLVAALTPKVPGTSKSGTLYGRYEVRFRADRLARGWKMAWLLWPDSGTNTSGSSSGVGGNGEINWPEKNLDSANVWGFVHHQDATSGSDQDWFKSETDIRQWHTYAIEWRPKSVILLLDGREIGRSTERVPNTPMHWVLQSETWFDKELPTQDMNLEIDWVSVWEYAPGASVGTVAPPAAPVAPVGPVEVTSPSPGEIVSGEVELETAAEGAVAVKWYVDEVEVEWDGSAPWNDSWNSVAVADGAYQVFSKAKQPDGSWATSESVTIQVANRGQTLFVTSPPPGAEVSGTVALSATAAVEVNAVKWYVDGTEVKYDDAQPWVGSWDSQTVSDGRHQIYAKARNDDGDWIVSASHEFAVDN